MIVKKVYNKGVGFLSAICATGAEKPFLNPMKAARLVGFTSTDVLADIGAYVGEASLIAAACGARSTAYEPTPQTFAVLQQNAHEKNIRCVNAAVVGDKAATTARLYLSRGIGVTNSTAKAKGIHIDVMAIGFREAIAGATVIKVDVEGAEYSYDWRDMPLDARAILLEFHPIVGMEWRRNADAIMELVMSQGFAPVLYPRFRHGWDTNSLFVR